MKKGREQTSKRKREREKEREREREREREHGKKISKKKRNKDV